LPTQCCSKSYQPCISSTDTQLQMYTEQSEYHFYQSVIRWISLCCQVHFNYIIHLSGVSRYILCWTFWPVWRHTLPPPVPRWSREWQPAEGKWTTTGRGKGRERGGSGILHMTKVLFGDVKILICGHKNQHTVLTWTNNPLDERSWSSPQTGRSSLIYINKIPTHFQLSSV
jgi:hypothetical protein